MNKHRGFTIVEIALVMVIMGIMATFALIKYNKTVASTELQKAADNLYAELSGLRALVFKYDAQIRVHFEPDAQQCVIYVDTSGTLQYEQLKTYKIPPPVLMGRSPSGGTYTEPYSYVNWKNPKPLGYDKGLIGSWRTEGALDVKNINGGEYEGGGVYLYHPRLDKITYFIGIAYQQSQSLDIKKWNGTSWEDR